jgi:hypothetical protein
LLIGRSAVSQSDGAILRVLALILYDVAARDDRHVRFSRSTSDRIPARASLMIRTLRINTVSRADQRQQHECVQKN